MRKTIHIKLTPAYKEQAINTINETIKLVSKKFNHNMTESDIRKVRNLSLDQVNVNVSQKTKSKTLWIFDAEDVLPIIITKESDLMEMGLIGQTMTQTQNFYHMNPNLTWILNNKKGGLSRQEFEEEVLKMLLEDFETAAFYGALSYITESDKHER